MTIERRREIAYKYMVNRARGKDFVMPSERRLTKMAGETGYTKFDFAEAYAHFKSPPAAPTTRDVQHLGAIALSYIELRTREAGLEINPQSKRKTGQVAADIDIPLGELFWFMRELVPIAVAAHFSE